MLILLYPTSPGSIWTIKDYIDNSNTGIVSLSTSVKEAFVLKNEDNELSIRALGLNPKIELVVDQIIGRTTQMIEINITNIGSDQAEVLLNDNCVNLNDRDIISSISSTSVVIRRQVKRFDELNIQIITNQNPDKFNYVVLGDTQGRCDIFEEMIPLINAQKPAFVLHCGDITTFSEDEEFKRFLALSPGISAPLFTTPGNHDVKFGVETYRNCLGSMDYSFDFGCRRFLALDSSRQTITDEQFTWLEGECTIENSEGTKKNILFTHVPPVGYLTETHGYLDRKVPTRLIHILENNSYEYCFAGHVHVYNYTLLNGIKYVITGGGGALPYAPEEQGGFRHFVVVHVDDLETTSEIVKFNDSFCHKDSTINISGYTGSIEFDIDDLYTIEYLEGESACQNQFGNWVGNGTYRGVDIKELLGFVGGMKPNDTLIIKSIDGYYQKFSYNNVYLNKTWREIQGPLVLSYEFDGTGPPDWMDGPRLVTLAPDGGYSLEDCKVTSVPNQGYWEYESAGARWVKNVVKILILIAV